MSCFLINQNVIGLFIGIPFLLDSRCCIRGWYVVCGVFNRRNYLGLIKLLRQLTEMGIEFKHWSIKSLNDNNKELDF